MTNTLTSGFKPNRKNTKRIIAAACVLALFGFTCLYVTYQSTNLYTAHASSGNNSSDCIGALLACAIAEMQADLARQEFGEDSQAYKDAKDHADEVCGNVPPDC